MISVVIPVYKNKEEFLKNLEHNIKYLHSIEIIIINDNPKESIKQDLEKYNSIILIENKKNIGFGATANKGIYEAKNRYILLLNSDVLLQDASYKQALSYFKQNAKLFAVSFAQKEKGGEIVGKNTLNWKKGFMNHEKAHDTKYGNNAWAEGGSCIIDKEKFENLGGFDPLYYPFYWEDFDLSYRAWKNDYSVIFDPAILVEHHHESTIGKYFPKNYIKAVSYRNQFIFIWKNITDKKLLINHFVNLLYFIPYYGLIKRNKELISGFFQAILRITTILKQRRISANKTILTDTQILKQFLS